MHRRISLFILSLLLMFSAIPISAQTPTPHPGPIYIVQEDDNSLWDIASRFNVSLADIVAINNITNPDIIFPGDTLIIPGLEDLTGTLVTRSVPFGETLQSLSRQYRVDPVILRKLNHITSPSELYAGYELVILQQDDQPAWTTRTSLIQGATLLELAVKADSDPWTIAQINGITSPSMILPGDTIYLPSGSSTSALGLPAAILFAELNPLPLVQGTTAQIKIDTSQTVTLQGLLAEKPLHFFPMDVDTQVALQGIHAMTDPGLYPLRLDVTTPDGSTQSFEQMVLIKPGDFPAESIIGVDAETIDPAITGPEEEWLAALTASVTPEKFWQGEFQLPVDGQYCLRSRFGNRRSYNEGALLSFHTGVDFGVCSEAHPFDIYAPADGEVVFTGLKTVRGNATIIDHGWGVFSGLYHQEEIYVSAGEHVGAGALIGKVGATGRVTGAHLHWELWVNGAQVNPLEWLEKNYPE